MSNSFEVTRTLDVKGLNCPMPVAKTGQESKRLADGEVLEVIATDSGSVSDLRAWADSTDGVEMLAQEEGEEDGQAVYRHYVVRRE